MCSSDLTQRLKWLAAAVAVATAAPACGPSDSTPVASSTLDGAASAADSAGSDTPAAPTPGADDGLVLVNPSTYNTLLGRPTDKTIAISVLAAKAGDKAFVEYGAALTPDKQGIVGGQNSTAAASQTGEPIVVELTGLAPDSKYYYRVHYQAGGQGDAADAIHSFRTQRAKGRTFHFGVQGDTHPERYNKIGRAHV